MFSPTLAHPPSGPPEPFDELSVDSASYASIVQDLEGRDLSALCAEIRDELEDAEVSFGSQDGAQRFVVDPVPRLISRAEWVALTAGLTQRVRALERFVCDVYSDREIVRAGVIPWSAVESSSYHEPALTGLEVGTWIPIAGLDVVRDESGSFRVLEDNLRTPSGLAYALAARRAVTARVGVPAGRGLASLEHATAHLGRAVAALAPPGVTEPNCILLTDGPANPAFYEHRTLADVLGMPLVAPEQLEQSAGRLFLRDGDRRTPVDVVYRRTNADRLFEPDGRPTQLAELLLDPWRAGRLGIANAFGSGVGDDKLIHSYVEDMVRFYLGEEPLLRSVLTWDLTDDAVRERALGRLGDLVVKPRDGHGGQGVVIGPLASAGELRRVADDVVAHPDRYVAQDTVMLSHHPTVCDGRLVGRHVDLRPFVVTIGDEVRVIPGGLSRVALERGSLMVNSSQNGGAKDTWILS